MKTESIRSCLPTRARRDPSRPVALHPDRRIRETTPEPGNPASAGGTRFARPENQSRYLKKLPKWTLWVLAALLVQAGDRLRSHCKISRKASPRGLPANRTSQSGTNPSQFFDSHPSRPLPFTRGRNYRRRRRAETRTRVARPGPVLVCRRLRNPGRRDGRPDGPGFHHAVGAGHGILLPPFGIRGREAFGPVSPTGGLYIWTRETCGEWHGFLCFWIYWLGFAFTFTSALLSSASMTVYAFGSRWVHLAESRTFVFGLAMVALVVRSART